MKTRNVSIHGIVRLDAFRNLLDRLCKMTGLNFYVHATDIYWAHDVTVDVWSETEANNAEVDHFAAFLEALKDDTGDSHVLFKSEQYEAQLKQRKAAKERLEWRAWLATRPGVTLEG